LESHVPLGCVTSSVTPPPVGAVTSFAHSTSRLGPRGSHRGWSAPEATPMLSPEWPKRRALMPDSYSLQMLDGAWGRLSRPNLPRASLSSGGPAPDLPLPPSSPLSPTAGPFPPPVGAAVAVPLTDGDGPALWSSTTDAQHAAGVERVKQCIRGPPSYSSNTSPPRVGGGTADRSGARGGGAPIGPGPGVPRGPVPGSFGSTHTQSRRHPLAGPPPLGPPLCQTATSTS